MNAKGIAFLDEQPVDLLHKQTVVDHGHTVEKWFVRFGKGGTGWIDVERLTDITLEGDQ
jgi:hypothetical protein